MKKSIYFLFILLSLFAFTGCGSVQDVNEDIQNVNKGIEDVNKNVQDIKKNIQDIGSQVLPDENKSQDSEQSGNKEEKDAKQSTGGEQEE